MKYFNHKVPTGIPKQRLRIIYKTNFCNHPLIELNYNRKDKNIIIDTIVQRIPKNFADSSYIVLQEETLFPTSYSLKQSLRWYTIFRISRVHLSV